MNFLLPILLISAVIYSIDAGECQVHNRPDYLSLASGKSTVSNFANNLATLLGLSSDQSENKEEPLLYSTRPLQIPSSTWLFHVEGLEQLSKDGIQLEDNGEFAIDSIHSKLHQAGDGDALKSGSVLITSESDMDNLEKTLEDQIAQIDNKASLKYIVIVCDDCSTDKSLEQLQNQLKTTINKIIANEPQTLAMTLTTKESARVRRARQVSDVASNITIATMYSDEYPVMFNLFFWTSLILVLIIISIVYVFLNLDPGSDTVIYRLTTPRLKSD